MSQKTSFSNAIQWFVMGLCLQLLFYFLVSDFGPSSGAAIGRASSLAKTSAVVLAAVILAKLGLARAIGRGRVASLHEALLTKSGILNLLVDSLSAKSFAIAFAAAYLLLLDFRAISPILPGSESEVRAVVLQSDRWVMMRSKCRRTMTFQVDSQYSPQKVCLTRKSDAIVPANASRLGQAVLLRVRSTPLYTVLESASDPPERE